MEPRRLLNSGNFTKLAIGSEFTFAITKTGGLFGWGNGYLEGKKSLQPEQIQSPAKFVEITAGRNHSAAIDDNGLVYTWGKEGDWMKGGGQLGHNAYETVVGPR